jgi:peptidyl-dipeptidase Dcp
MVSYTSSSKSICTSLSNQSMPMSLVERIQNASTFNEGFSTVETISSALVDMKLHQLEDLNINPKEYEAKTLKELNMPSEIVMRHRIPQFGHIFSNDDYAAGYYGYLWADVISADATEAFRNQRRIIQPSSFKKTFGSSLALGILLIPKLLIKNLEEKLQVLML